MCISKFMWLHVKEWVRLTLYAFETLGSIKKKKYLKNVILQVEAKRKQQEKSHKYAAQ